MEGAFQMSTAVKPGRRADAVRNRRLALQAATTLLAEPGAALTVEAIATKAGLGAGTVVRAFGGKDALLDAAVSGLLEPVVRRASDLLHQTRPDQALTYRLSGDRNPLHSDPEFAKLGGFDRPILHGLCTFGFTGRALLHSLCGSDPAKFTSMEARFSKPVYPGDSLTVKMWVDGNEAVYTTETQTGDVVIDQGLATFSA